MHEVMVKGILSARNGMNLYRGCSHGCIYCDSRSRCYQINHDFEDIQVKKNGPQLLEDALSRKRKKCMIGTGAMCDPYMHIEKELNHTRRCIELIEAYDFGLAIQTKSTSILRDLELLKSINGKTKCVVQMTLTTYDKHFPGIKQRYIKRYGYSYEVPSPNNNNLMGIFHEVCEAHGILHSNDACFDYLSTFKEGVKTQQLRFPGL
ncbi:MAG TPA: radical SAM protein [Bacillota bacterium]|nr:radical SAM protein [Bacillota bacterium]